MSPLKTAVKVSEIKLYKSLDMESDQKGEKK